MGRKLFSPLSERIGLRLLSGLASAAASGFMTIKVGTVFVFIVHLLFVGLLDFQC